MASQYRVMIKCFDGTSKLVNGGSPGCYWERGVHVITWAFYDTLEDAENERAQIIAGKSRDLLGVWAKRVA